MMIPRKAFLLIFSLLSMAILFFAPSVLASTSSDRLMGNDRYLTAIAISQKSWPNGTDTAILTTGENFPDALSAAPLAQKYNAPILLTEFNSLNSNTLTELRRLNVKKVYIIGGSGAISDKIDKELSTMGISSLRLAGQDRYETALLVANEVGISKGIFAVSGLDFPDALSAAPIAAAKGMPIILVPSDDLTPSQKSFFSKNTIPNTYIINDNYNYEISDKIIKQLPSNEVIYGSNPYERNINLLNKFTDDLDFSTVYLATGKAFPDALAASALAQKKNNAIILLDGDAIPSEARTFIATKVVGTINVLGGDAVITQNTETELKTLPLQIASIANLTPTIQEKQDYVLPKTVIAKLTNGLTSEVWVTWSLSTVDTAKTGTYYYKGKVNGYDGSVNLTLTISSSLNNTRVDNISAEIVLGGSYTLPSTVEVIMNDNSIEDLPVTWSTKITMPNKTGTYTYQGSIEGISQKATLTLKVSSDVKVTIKDPALEELIRSKCDKEDETETLYLSDIIYIEYLNAESKNIEDLNGIEYLSNLKKLNLGDNDSLTSAKLAPLGKLTNLKTLWLNNLDEVSDISVLKKLTKLEVLDLRHNDIKDFSPLKTLTNLRELYLKYNSSTDYNSLTPIYDNLIEKDFDLD